MLVDFKYSRLWMGLGPAHVQLSKMNWRLKVFWKPDL